MKEVVDLFFELSIFKNLPRSGSFLATQIAFVLCEMEGGKGERSGFFNQYS